MHGKTRRSNFDIGFTKSEHRVHTLQSDHTRKHWNPCFTLKICILESIEAIILPSWFPPYIAPIYIRNVGQRWTFVIQKQKYQIVVRQDSQNTGERWGRLTSEPTGAVALKVEVPSIASSTFSTRPLGLGTFFTADSAASSVFSTAAWKKEAVERSQTSFKFQIEVQNSNMKFEVAMVRV